MKGFIRVTSEEHADCVINISSIVMVFELANSRAEILLLPVANMRQETHRFGTHTSGQLTRMVTKTSYAKIIEQLESQ